MLNEDQLQNVIGQDLYSQDGDKIGRVGQVFIDDQTGRPEFATVHTGLFGTKESFVPIAEASFSGDRTTVPVAKDQVKNAPNVSVDDGHLSQDQERELYEYYGMGYSESRSDSGLSGGTAGEGQDVRGETGRDTSGPTTDDAMTRSEERLRVGTTSEEAGRARLRKYVVTEQETQTVPVRKERAVVESEPVTDANRDAAVAGPDISDEEHEVTLHEERPVVEKTTEPVERVRLGTEQDTDEETVNEQVRKEQIEAEGDIDDKR